MFGLVGGHFQIQNTLQTTITKNVILFDINIQFVPHSRHVMYPLQSSAC
jgi:hypothetical protein